jgi:hypothetical protein
VYDLVANITHVGGTDSPQCKAHVLHKANKTWYEIDDLHIGTIQAGAHSVSIRFSFPPSLSVCVFVCWFVPRTRPPTAAPAGTGARAD